MFVDQIQPIQTLASARFYILSVTVHLASVLAVARISGTEAGGRLQNLGAQYSQEETVVRAARHLVRYVSETSHVPGVWTVSGLVFTCSVRALSVLSIEK